MGLHISMRAGLFFFLEKQILEGEQIRQHCSHKLQIYVDVKTHTHINTHAHRNPIDRFTSCSLRRAFPHNTSVHSVTASSGAYVFYPSWVQSRI